MFIIDIFQNIWIFIKYGRRQNYLVSYSFLGKNKSKSGFGTTTFTFNKRQLSSEGVKEIREEILENSDFENVVILNIIRLYGKAYTEDQIKEMP